MNKPLAPKLSILTLALLAACLLFTQAWAQAKKPVTAAVQYRTITVSTQPDVTVFIDGVRYGKTDQSGTLRITSLAVGAHTLGLRADGFKERSQPITAIQKGEIRVTLVKTTDEAELAFQEAERLASSDRDKSVDAYKRAVKLRPAYPEAFVGMARVLAEAGDFDEAQAAITSARKLRPGYPEAGAVMGRIYKENGDEARAIAAFQRAIIDGKGFQPEAYAGLGLLYKEKAEGFGGSGDFEKEAANYADATKNLKSALKQLSGAPDAMVIYQLLGLIYERQKKYADAIATYEEFLRIFPTSNEAEAVRSFIVQLKKDQTPQE